MFLFAVQTFSSRLAHVHTHTVFPRIIALIVKGGAYARGGRGALNTNALLEVQSLVKWFKGFNFLARYTTQMFWRTPASALPSSCGGRF